jgi:hypothetical protein
VQQRHCWRQRQWASGINGRVSNSWQCCMSDCARATCSGAALAVAVDVTDATFPLGFLWCHTLRQHLARGGSCASVVWPTPLLAQQPAHVPMHLQAGGMLHGWGACRTCMQQEELAAAAGDSSDTAGPVQLCDSRTLWQLMLPTMRLCRPPQGL